MTKVSDVFQKPVDFRQYKEDTYWVLPDCQMGIELELEGFKTKPSFKAPAYWHVKEDHSLRAINNAQPYELVSAFPYCGADLTLSLKQLEHFLDTVDPKPVASKRTSLHVHIDMRSMALHDLYEFVLLYLIFEKALFKYCGANRDNNIFCLPLYKAKGYLFNSISKALLTSSEKIMNTIREDYRYSALNFAALGKFGSFEFRHHPGTINTQSIRDWINIIMCLKKYIQEHSVSRLVSKSTLDEDSIMDLFQNVFGQYSNLLLYDDLIYDCIDGSFNAREVAHRDRLIKKQKHLLQKECATNKLPVNESLCKYGEQRGVFAYLKRPEVSLTGRNKKLTLDLPLTIGHGSWSTGIPSELSYSEPVIDEEQG